MALAEHLLRHAGNARAALAEVPDLETRLVALLDEARRAWPEVDLGAETFVRHLAERLPEEDPVGALGATRAADLYLACACAAGIPSALAAFERSFVAQVPQYLARKDVLPAFSEEVKQALRVRLLVSEEGLTPRIGTYSGRGPLSGWVRVAAARSAIDLSRAAGGTAGGGEDPDGLETALADPELAFLRADCRAEIQQSLSHALAALPAREATMLRLHFVDGLGTATIGELLGVSERTARRWLAETRARLVQEMRQRLVERFSLSASNVAGLLALVESQLDLSIRRSLERSDG